MATVTPGSAGKINKLVGYTQVLSVTAAELAGDVGDMKLTANLFIVLPDGKVVLTDGTTALKDLTPRIDQTLVKVEKDALAAAFDAAGKYQAVEGGVVLHGADGKIDDAELNLVADGKLVEDYLSEYIEDGKVKLSALPDTVRAGVAYFATYAAMTADATDENKKGLCFVIDATDDPSGKVGKGAAMYVWQDSAWLKITEVESLDIDIASLTPDHDNVEAAGAVMYDHPVFIGDLTLTELAALTTAPAEGD